MDLSSVVAALGAVVLERTQSGRFIRTSDAPAWWAARVADPDRRPVEIDALFPFLTVFLPHAERAWRAAKAIPISSELWTETDANGAAIHLEAIAARVGTNPVLVIARNDRVFDEQQQLLQRARELRMTYDAFMREIERKDILLHTIVHDLSAPLHSIVGALSLLRELSLPAPAARWTELAFEAATRQRDLIRTILNVFTTEHQPTAATETVEVRPALVRAMSEREPVARQRQVKLQLELVDVDPIIGDEMRLLRVLTNLLDNAIRHSPTGGMVSVTSRVDGSSLLITVDDEGGGVSPQLLPHLFDKLASDPRGGGTGLGLYFCRITVEQWGGGIGYEPRVPRGSRFWIRVPTAAPRAQPEQVVMNG
jgi:signal transduction histidine kinase